MIEEIEFLSKELTSQGHIKVQRGDLVRGSGDHDRGDCVSL
jgi:hypothetical protein